MITKVFKIIEIVLIIFLIFYIKNRWNVTNITVGDFFCLEVLAMLFWYEYDKVRNKFKK